MQLPASFRDPSVFLFQQDGVTYRQLNLVYKDGYDHLTSSGLYQALVDSADIRESQRTLYLMRWIQR
ncbi:MAG: hypothetical protein ABSF21_01565 [Dehalococcoidia bacterium]